MKTILIVILATLSSGCAVDPRFAQDFAQGLQYQSYRAQQQAYQPSPALATPKQTDFACVTQCANGGTLYARCLSLCSY